MGSGSSPGGGQPTRGKPNGLRGGAPTLSGLVGQPKRALAPREEKPKRKKGEVGRKRRTPLSNPNWSRIPPLLPGRRTLEDLVLKASLLPLPPIYSGDLGLI